MSFHQTAGPAIQRLQAEGQVAWALLDVMPVLPVEDLRFGLAWTCVGATSAVPRRSSDAVGHVGHTAKLT
eukprot:1790764-Pyramimonas_sp.AAC.1